MQSWTLKYECEYECKCKNEFDLNINFSSGLYRNVSVAIRTERRQGNKGKRRLLSTGIYHLLLLRRFLCETGACPLIPCQSDPPPNRPQSVHNYNHTQRPPSHPLHYHGKTKTTTLPFKSSGSHHSSQSIHITHANSKPKTTVINDYPQFPDTYHDSSSDALPFAHILCLAYHNSYTDRWKFHHAA